MRFAEALCVFIFGMTARRNPMGSTKPAEGSFYHDRRFSGPSWRSLAAGKHRRVLLTTVSSLLEACQIPNTEAELRKSLRDLADLIESSDGAESEARKARFGGLIDRIDALGSSLPAEAHELRHFIKRHSFAKALDHLEQRPPSADSGSD